MRAASISSSAYQPGEPPADVSQMQRFMREELARIKAALDALAAGHLDRAYRLPDKPRDGDVRYLDATIAPSGAGTGIYWFDGATWTKL